MNQAGKDLYDHGPTPPHHLNPGTESHVQAFLKHFQGWFKHHLPRQTIPVPNHSFSEEFFSDLWPKLPLVQLRSSTMAFAPLQPSEPSRSLLVQTRSPGRGGPGG